MPKLYLAYVPDPHFQDCIEQAVDVIRSDHPDLSGWEIRLLPLQMVHGVFNPLDVYAVIAQALGPLILIGGVKQSAVAMIHQKLAGRSIIQSCDTVADSTDVWASILDVVERHNRGEPEWPRKLAVALLLVAKLARKNYWGGEAKAKNFLRVDDLANGNGLDERYKGTAHEVADYLASTQRRVRLLTTKLGDGRVKYACNSEERAAVYAFLRDRCANDEAIMKFLTRDPARVPNSELESIRPEDFLDERSQQDSAG